MIIIEQFKSKLWSRISLLTSQMDLLQSLSQWTSLILVCYCIFMPCWKYYLLSFTYIHCIQILSHHSLQILYHLSNYCQTLLQSLLTQSSLLSFLNNLINTVCLRNPVMPISPCFYFLISISIMIVVERLKMA